MGKFAEWDEKIKPLINADGSLTIMKRTIGDIASESTTLTKAIGNEKEGLISTFNK
jgi:hypothetical protein